MSSRGIFGERWRIGGAWRGRVARATTIGIVGGSALLQAPHLARTDFGGAASELAIELADVPFDLVKTASREVTGRHLGFDTNIYPGDRAMRAWRSTPYEWVGYYLPAPCHKDESWSGKRERLTDMGWGLAVIYVGQQTWGTEVKKAAAKKKPAAKKSSARKTTTAKKRSTASKQPGQMNRRSAAPVAKSNPTCLSTFVSGPQGRLEARDAIRKTIAEGFAPGSVIFLDVERMEQTPQAMRDYYRAWTRELLADGRFRPGIYAHAHNATRIYTDVKAEYAAAGVRSEPPFWIAGKSSQFDIDKMPHEVGHSFAAVWQGLLDVTRTHSGVKLPIDINVAALPSPSSHEYAD